MLADKTKEPVGPFRVYLQYAWSPGLACSRAFGDKMAVEVGVTHKPDVILHKLEPEDQFLIMASDGIWELISSQVSQVHEAKLLQRTRHMSYDSGAQGMTVGLKA